jgi:hypothetical protein
VSVCIKVIESVCLCVRLGESAHREERKGIGDVLTVIIRLFHERESVRDYTHTQR